MARAPLDGRDQSADLGVLRGHLNQIKGFFLFASSAKGDLQALLLPPRAAQLLLLHPLQGQPEEGGVQAAAGAGSIQGMVEVEIGVTRTASIKSNGSAKITVPATIHI